MRARWCVNVSGRMLCWVLAPAPPDTPVFGFPRAQTEGRGSGCPGEMLPSCFVTPTVGRMLPVSQAAPQRTAALLRCVGLGDIGVTAGCCRCLWDGAQSHCTAPALLVALRSPSWAVGLSLLQQELLEVHGDVTVPMVTAALGGVQAGDAAGAVQPGRAGCSGFTRFCCDRARGLVFSKKRGDPDYIQTGGSRRGPTTELQTLFPGLGADAAWLMLP